MNLDVLKQGIAIVHSSGNNTGTHYNLELAGETAMMTKERFVERYGVPTYTVGLGGSGGAIQQYILRQNQPGILDAMLPVQSYPDMVTQTIHVGDCELLEYYMDATDRTNAEVAHHQEPHLAGGHERGGNPPGGPNGKVNDPLAPLKTALGYSTAVGSTRMRARVARPDAARDEPAVRQCAEPAELGAALRHRGDPLDALGRPAQHLRRQSGDAGCQSDVGQRRRAVRLAVDEGRQDHAAGIPAPELERRRLEAAGRDGAGRLPVLRHQRMQRSARH